MLSGREADHLPPSNTEIKNSGAILALPRLYGIVLNYIIKYRDNFTHGLVSDSVVKQTTAIIRTV
jgi:hypothetical protein